jgi:ferredoxin
MSYIVCAGCVGCKHTTCVDVCPVDAFRESDDILVIDPQVCIDCGVCEPECPVEAIFSEECVPSNEKEYIEINRVISMVAPPITRSKKQSVMNL